MTERNSNQKSDKMTHDLSEWVNLQKLNAPDGMFSRNHAYVAPAMSTNVIMSNIKEGKTTINIPQLRFRFKKPVGLVNRISTTIEA